MSPLVSGDQIAFIYDAFVHVCIGNNATAASSN